MSETETNWKLVTGPGALPYLASGRVCATEQGMVFKVLSLKQGIQSLFSVLNRMTFWAGGRYVCGSNIVVAQNTLISERDQ